jgi:type I restriction enzyme S subunit
VDFEFPNENGEPYKSSGGEMVESELGLIPKGWSVKELGEVVTRQISGDWGKAELNEKFPVKVSCIRGADIPELKKGNEGKMPLRYIKEKAFNDKKLQKNDVVIEGSGGSPTQSTGRTVLISEEMLKKLENPLICSNFCKILRADKLEFSTLSYMLLQYLYDIDYFFQFENGTTGIKNLDISGLLENTKLAIPKEIGIISQFNIIVNDIIEKIQSNGDNSKKLSKTRDTLLPKLMNGEIDVNEVEI